MGRKRHVILKPPGQETEDGSCDDMHTLIIGQAIAGQNAFSS